MKLLTDECIHQPIIQLFRLHHHDVKDIKELGLSRMSDDDVLNLAKSKNRVLVTLNKKHFTKWKFFLEKEHPGIIVINIRPGNWRIINPFLDIFLYAVNEEELIGRYTIIYRDKAEIYSEIETYQTLVF
jgi:predicted nuclease of predicted toxin-antitoxin system